MTKPVPMDGVGDVAASNHAVIRRTQAAALGLTAPQIRQLKRQSALREPAPGVLVVHGSAPSWRQDMAIVTSAVGGRAVISHRSAAALHQLDGFESGIVEVTVLRGELAHLSTYLPGLVRHQVSDAVQPSDVTIIDGLPCTTLARTLIDLPSVIDDALMQRALDDYERRGFSLSWLEQVAEQLRRPGHRGPRFILAEVGRRRDRGMVRGSWMEKLVADCLVSPLLPEPVAQFEIRDQLGQFVARVDLAFPALRLAFEAHSRGFHAAVSDGLIDQRRENRAIVAGWLFVYLGWVDRTTPKRTLAFIEQVAQTRSLDLGFGSLRGPGSTK